VTYPPDGGGLTFLRIRVGLAIPAPREFHHAMGHVNGSVEEVVIDTVEIDTASADLSAHSPEETMRALEAVRRGLAGLRVAGSPLQLLQRAATELVVSCGFERAVITRMTAPATMVATAWHADPDPADFDRRLAIWREHPPGVTHLQFEGELVRLRRAGLMPDARTNPLTYKPIIEALATEAYVAAPLTPGAQVEGMVHADCLSRQVDDLDCAVLAAFAEGLSIALERATIAERVRVHEQRLRGLLGQADGALETLVEGTFDMVVPTPDSGEPVRATSARREPASKDVPMGVLSLLTRREIEVLDMMSGGATNAAIGEALIISEVTVKSHVQHILRKLRAANRAEASARYIRLRHGG
jgi:LuxR family transcriptional regulator, regulator of acetate metabolism